MSERVFIDTNVFVYADDADAPAKQERAQQIILQALKSGTGVTSTQVLQEYFSVVTRKLGIPAEIAQQKVQLMATLSVISIDVSHIIEGIKLHRLYSLSFWDALVIQAARLGGCKEVLTEDMQTGQLIETVRVRNPFL